MFCAFLLLTGLSYRNEKHLASTRSLLHLLIVLFPPLDLLRLVTSIHSGVRLSRQAGLDVCGHPLPGRLNTCINTSVLLRRSSARTWGGWPPWPQTTARAFRSSRRHEGRGSSGIRILLRRLDSRLLPTLCTPLHHPVHPNARHQPPEPRFHILRQSAVPGRGTVLESDHVLGGTMRYISCIIHNCC